MELPPGFRFQLVVADNNPDSQYDAYIAKILASCPFPTHYGHEPETGYSSARNKGLELALATDSEIIGFIDDDLEIAPDWLCGQIRSYSEFDCDAVGGPVIGSTRSFEHGAVRAAWGMANFTFRRKWVEKSGLNLRFDPACNLTGYEDARFTQSASDQGQRIVLSEYSKVIDPAPQDDPLKEARNRADVAVVAARNRCVAMRKQGNWVGVMGMLAGSLHYGLKAFGLYVLYFLKNAAGKGTTVERSRCRIESSKEFRKMLATFGALQGDYTPRQSIRRND